MVVKKANSFPCFRDITWTKTLGFLTTKLRSTKYPDFEVYIIHINKHTKLLLLGLKNKYTKTTAPSPDRADILETK